MPGPRSAAIDAGTSKVPGAAKRRTAAGIPLGRLAEPEETSEATLFHLSDRASCLNGQAIAVDGGRSAT